MKILQKKLTKFQILKAIVIRLSENKDWEIAKFEWYVERYYDDYRCTTTCNCTKEGLRHVYVIKNRLNGNRVTPVGSVCIKRFENQEMIKEMMSLRQFYKEIKKWGKRVFTHSVKRGQSIEDICEDSGFIQFVKTKRKRGFDEERNADYDKLLAFYNLKIQELKLND
jgi:hypothetical protein